MRTDQQYQDCLNRLFGLRRFGIKLGLETIQNVLDQLGNPEKNLACIHVAGTNGKGSVASLLADILAKSGFKTGLYTSPHLVRFNERIRVNGEQITDAHVVRAYQAVDKAHFADRELTYFEYATAMALFHFAKEKVDWAIMETGMGGRLDATNAIFPKVCVITNLSLEHQGYLGKTLGRIAREKAGIIKKGVPVVTGVTQKKALETVTRKAREMGAPCHVLGRDFKIRRNGPTRFTYFGENQVLRNLETRLSCRHMADNAALSLAVCEILENSGVSIRQKDLYESVRFTQWPGRLEMVSQNPYLLLDGAHNRAAAKNLAAYLDQNLSHKNIHLVLGILDDKPYEDMLSFLLPCASRVYFTRPVIDRAMDPEILAKKAAQIKPDLDIRVIPGVAGALEAAVKAAKKSDAVCVAGSLYVVGEAKAALEQDPKTGLSILN